MHDHNKGGFSLIETMIAMFILVFALISLAQRMPLAIVVNKNQGGVATKATGFAHDKVEELTGLAFTDGTTNVTVNPNANGIYPATGRGLLVGGNLPPAAPADANYFDYLDQFGARTTTAANIAFTRQWQITDLPVGGPTSYKQITVGVTSNKSFRSGNGALPVTVSTTLKTQ